MSKETIKQQFQQANKLISAQRYDEARALLLTIDHPQAKLWLKQLADKRKQSAPGLITPTLLLYTVAGVVIVLGVIAALVVGPNLIESTRPDPASEFDEFGITDDEMLYSHVASYCYAITGYGGELCLDWADMVMADYNGAAQTCVSPHIDTPTLADEDYATISVCLTEASVPPPL